MLSLPIHFKKGLLWLQAQALDSGFQTLIALLIRVWLCRDSVEDEDEAEGAGVPGTSEDLRKCGGGCRQQHILSYSILPSTATSGLGIRLTLLAPIFAFKDKWPNSLEDKDSTLEC